VLAIPLEEPIEEELVREEQLGDMFAAPGSSSVDFV
jgi:hypothetical protein